MSNKAPNPQAFPLAESVHECVNAGMSLRDYFATAALQGILANEGSRDALLGDLISDCFADNDAKRAYIYADAMLKARRRE